MSKESREKRAEKRTFYKYYRREDHYMRGPGPACERAARLTDRYPTNSDDEVAQAAD